MFDFTKGVRCDSDGRERPPARALQRLVESTFTAAQKTTLQHGRRASRTRSPSTSRTTSASPYPFDSIGAVADRLPSAPGLRARGPDEDPLPVGDIDRLNTLAHEIAHQWFGNSVALGQWQDIWLNEGWATWWRSGTGPTSSTAARHPRRSSPRTTTTRRNPTRWNSPPGNLPGAADLFNTFPVYTRPAMMIEGLRQIVGDTAFCAMRRPGTRTTATATITRRPVHRARQADRGREEPASRRRTCASSTCTSTSGSTAPASRR